MEELFYTKFVGVVVPILEMFLNNTLSMLRRNIYNTTCTIVFDGYSHGLSTKDHEHIWRSAKQCALELATTCVHVNVVADDTDVALLLLYHWNDTMADITITSERTKATFGMKSSMNSHSSLLKPYLLVLHSWTGCDTTSAFHMKGKTSLLKKIETSLQVRQMLNTLRDPNADQLEVGVAGIKLFLQQSFIF